MTTAENLKAVFPHLSDEKLQRAAAIFDAAKPLRDEIITHPNEQVRDMLQTQISQLILSAVQTL